MTVYWLMFFIPVLATISPFRSTAQLDRATWLLVGVLFVCVIGFRYEIGVDWTAYLDQYDVTVGKSFLNALATASDPGYAALNWLAALFGLQVYAVNLIGAVFFMTGLIVFCRQQPLPWLAFAIAAPYLVIVVAMNYNRQAVALGFLFLALADLSKLNQFRFVVWVLVAALFHKTALFVLPVGVLMSTQRNAIRAFAILALFALLALALLAEQYDALWYQYVEVGMVSEGGTIRVWMNATAAIVLLVTRKYWRRRWPDTQLWIWLSLLALACVPLVGLASTAVDRMALYLIPLQLVVFSRLPTLITDVINRTLAVVAVLLVYGAVLWVWLNYAIHAEYWLPYKNVTFLPF